MLRVCLILLVASICLLSTQGVSPVRKWNGSRLSPESVSMQGLRGDASPFAEARQSL